MKEIYDIIREMRRLGKLDEKSNNRIPRSLMGLGLRTYSDRIEAAVKSLEADRDNWRRQALDEDARANATCKESLQFRNEAAMREALEEFVKYSELVQRMGIFVRDSLVKITTKARAALAKPHMNINKINNYDEMVDAWNNYVRTRHGMLDGFFVWLFDKAKGE